MSDATPPDGDVRPLSRRSTKLLVIFAVVAAFAIAIISAIYLTRTAQETQERQESLAPDTVETR